MWESPERTYLVGLQLHGIRLISEALSRGVPKDQLAASFQQAASGDPEASDELLFDDAEDGEVYRAAILEAKQALLDRFPELQVNADCVGTETVCSSASSNQDVEHFFGRIGSNGDLDSVIEVMEFKLLRQAAPCGGWLGGFGFLKCTAACTSQIANGIAYAECLWNCLCQYCPDMQGEASTILGIVIPKEWTCDD